ncbi:arabinofuranosidase catalytic domain-containing protein [Aestuariivirga sp.]|uniref:arabinofuranosidase catalytic domain-containing protein n=1 Tax=Aestuariivirga sp. TaxID=2650926 RepID=UPI003BABAE9E
MLWLAAVFWLLSLPAAAATLNFTVAASEPVTVTGTPRIAIDVGGVTRYATYASGSGTSALTFSYPVQAGDFDANGITLASPLELNGGSITDLAGNSPSNLNFTLPDTSSLKVQTYTAAFAAISNANATAVSFTISKVPAGASFSYTITSAGGSGSLTGSGTIGSSPHTVSGLDVSSLITGTLTLSVTVSTVPGGTGMARTATAVPSFSGGALDGLTSSAAAYSTRRLSAAYSGPLLRVRRASDNTEQDIPFTIGGDLSQTALAGFCGSSSCFVRSWYDQSGNGLNAVQVSSGSQPRLVNGGAVELLGTRPAVRFASSQQLGAASPLANSNEFTIAIVTVERNRYVATAWRLLTSTANTLRVLAHMPWSDGVLYFDMGTNTSPYRISKAWPVALNTPAIVTFQNSASANTRGVYLNGTLFLSGNGYPAAADTLQVGPNYDGHFAEFILFPASISSAERLTLERSQGAYYGITVP